MREVPAEAITAPVSAARPTQHPTGPSRRGPSRRVQSRRGSLLESTVSTGIGLVVALVAQVVLFPAVGIAASAGVHLKLAAAFTLVSLLRGYLVRRLFEHLGRAG